MRFFVALPYVLEQLKLYKKTFSNIGVTVVEGGTFLVNIDMQSKHTYTDTTTQRKFTAQSYSLIATTPSAEHYKNKVIVDMGCLQYFPGGVRCLQDPNDNTSYFVDPKWLAFRATENKTKKSYALNASDAYCSVAYTIGGKDVVYTRSGVAKWTKIANK